MAVMTMKWKKFVLNYQQYNKLVDIIDTTITNLASEVDATFNTKYGVSTKLSSALSMIKTDYLSNDERDWEYSPWNDLDIYMSSFKIADKRPYYTYQDKLIRYLKFFNKMIADDGLARRVMISRNFSNTNQSAGTDKNYFSETPQIELTNFEEGIKYASNLGKNESLSSSNQSGNSGEIATTKTWDEELKNLRFAFYNDLMDFIVDIPNVLYSYYCLDSRPAVSIIKANYDYIKNIIENKIV